VNQLLKRVAALAAFGVAVAGCASTGSAPGEHHKVSELVFIGDSNLDIGRAFAERAGNNNDGKVVPPNTVGKRYSNGEILPEYLSQRLGVTEVNYAWGGATSGMTNIAGAGDLHNTGTLAQMAEVEVALSGKPADPNALYMVMAGSNDLASVDKNNQAAVDAAIAGVVANLRGVVTKLDSMGVKFIVVGTRTPRPVVSNHDRASDEPEAEAKNDAAGRQMNIAIRKLVSDLDKELGADVEVYDFYADIRDIADHAQAYGFAAYSSDPANYCSAKGQTDCSRLINYDGAHKTSAVHSILADKFIKRFGLARE
jgi:phospholipase/lecithinase/hemolysin